MAKNKSLKGLGARYGIKIRKQYTKIHFQLKEKRTCPECGSQQFTRDAVG
ncbi:MAG: 50S ribosomal protein L37, partial [Thermoproteota archaeon]